MAADTSPDRRELLKTALGAIEQLKAKVRALEAAAVDAGAAEAIAIVGAGCRFPGGANGLDAYWSILRTGRDVVAEIPASRWETVGETGATAGWHAGLVDGIDTFDPRFFGISAREATTMDPQQRMVLEVAWEALEHAGQAPDGLAGTRTGVFLGITGHDYADLLHDAGGLLDVYAATGNANNAAAGRLSFLLGLQGPSLAVDTACSSSLVAIHLACTALRAGDCRMALAGGVNALLTAAPFVCFRNWGMMASDGHCKTFDARADGFVRGEGCGIVVLKRLSDARADGDRVLAVIRGSAVNQDGRSSGLTVPNGPAQEAVIRQALDVARLDPAEVGYVEAHGTGTALGDPIEAHALAAVLGAGRRSDQPLVVGSVKTNIGHLESAAGVAGLLKVVLALRHEHIPAHLHFTAMNPDIDWGEVPVDIPVAGRAWPASTRRRVAGVSSFGFSGTNAHVIIEEAPPAVDVTVARPIGERTSHLLALSGRTEAARDALAAGFAETLAHGNAALADVCHSTNAGRAHFAERLAVVAATRDELREKLKARSWIEGHAKAGGARVAFLFTGQGSQWAGMGRELYDTEPVFRDALDACAALLPLGRPLLDVLYGDAAALLDETAYTQPALFAVQWALAALWKSWGIVPDAVLGHSVGEYAALCVAGVWPLADGLRVIAERGQLMQELGDGWGMAAVQGGRARAAEALRGLEPFVSVAAANAPENTVISGRAAELREATRRLEMLGVAVRPLPVSHAFHSMQMDPMAPEFARRVEGITTSVPSARVVSSVTGQFVNAAELRDPGYWRHQIRDAVEFQTAMTTLAEAGYDTFLEIGPTATLTNVGRQCVGRAGQLWAPSLRRDAGASRQMLESLGRLYVRGAHVEWGAVGAAFARDRVDVPTYPFQRQRYWIDGAPRTTTDAVPNATPIDRVGPRPTSGHPLLGPRFTIAGATTAYAWETAVSFETFPYLADHRVQGGAVVPATAYLEMAVAAGHAILGAGAIEAADVEFHKPLFLAPQVEATVQVRYEELDGAVQIHSRTHATAPWTLHATARVRRAADAEPIPAPSGFEGVADREIDGGAFYRAFEASGNQWGPTFQGVDHAWLTEREGWSRVIVPEPLRPDVGRYHVHPAVADACGHVLAALTAPDTQDAGGGAFVGQGIDRVCIYDRPRGTRLLAHARVTPTADAKVRRGDVRVFDEDGRLVSALTGARLRYLEFGDEGAAGSIDQWFYDVAWREVAFTDGPRTDGPRTDGPRTDGRPDDRAAGGAAGWTILVGDDAQARLAGALAACMRADGVDGTAIVAAGFEALGPVPNGHRLAGVIDLRALSMRAPDDLGAAAELTTGFVDLVRAAAAAPAAPLWVVTAGVHAVGGVDDARGPTGVWQAPLWGLGRTLAVEHPELFGGLVDLDHDVLTGDVEGHARTLWRHLSASGGEGQVALRGGGRFAARLTRADVPARVPLRVRADGTYLVTGGLGGLGLEAARWLARSGARRLLLLGRTALPPRTEWRSLPSGHPHAAAVATIRELEAAGTAVQTVAIDVADRTALETLLGSYAREGWPPIRGVVHTAGVLRHATLLELTPQAVGEILRPKLGAWALERALGDAPLDFFVLFSSASALLSSPRLGAYAAANAFLDAFALERRARGAPALSVNWGVWGEAGMASRFDAEDVRALADRGMGAMRTDEGFAALERLMGGTRANAAVLPVNWTRWAALYPSYTAAPLLAEVLAGRGAARAADPPDAGGLLSAPASEQPARLLAHLTGMLGTVLGFAASDIAPDVSISALGLDSLTALEFKNRIAATLGVSLPTVRFLRGPTLAELAGEVAPALAGASAEAARAHQARAHRAPAGPTDAELLEQIDALTEAELDAALAGLSSESPRG